MSSAKLPGIRRTMNSITKKLDGICVAGQTNSKTSKLNTKAHPKINPEMKTKPIEQSVIKQGPKFKDNVESPRKIKLDTIRDEYRGNILHLPTLSYHLLFSD